MRRSAGWLLVGLCISACSDSATLADVSPGQAVVRRVVAQGAVDTIRFSSSVAAAVDNRLGPGDLEVSLSSAGDNGILTPKIALGSVVLRMTSGSPAAGIRDGHSGETGAVVTLLVNTVQRAATSIRQFLLVDRNDPLAIPLWTTSTATQYVDPKDGGVKTIEAVSLTPPVGQSSDYLLQLADMGMECDLGPRLVDLDRSAGSGDRVPLVLIHGWQWNLIACRRDGLSRGQRVVWNSFQEWDTDDNVAPFESLLADLNAAGNAALRARYHIYVLHYPTFRRVITASTYLRDQLMSLPGGAPVIVAHSMGGLVARGMMGLSGAPPVRGLITLGTPHGGSPFASILAGVSSATDAQVKEAAKTCGILSQLFVRLSTSIPVTAGARDLAEGSELVNQLTGDRPFQDRVYTIGGGSLDTDKLGVLLGPLACIAAKLPNSTETDGVVPVESSLPSWSAGHHFLENVNHIELPSNSQARTLVRGALTRLAACQQAPPPPTSGRPFAVSGSIARKSSTEIDVTLNGIVVDGEIQRNLPKSSFTIVENGCALPQEAFELTTAEGRVGIDLVFIQDLSSSMTGEIAGVRASVGAFAVALAAQGLDARFGAVGYSGAGTIPSTPATSSTEFLGPAQLLTDVSAFQSHISTQWSASGGGDGPENGLEAIEYAMNFLNWRPGAARVMVNITDAGHHTSSTSCNGRGPCTDQSLLSTTNLLAGRVVLHAVASSNGTERTPSGALDPWFVAAATGGRSLGLGSGDVDLTTLGITDALAATTRLTFRSASPTSAPENLRILVTINGRTSELSPGLIQYVRVHSSLMR